MSIWSDIRILTVFSDILIAKISWTVAQTPIRYIIFWKTVIKTFRSIYVNCFNTLRFLAEASTKLQKMHFLDNLRTIIQERNTETRKMIPSFLSTFSALTVCNIHFYIWKWSKFIFLWGPFGLFWSAKYLNFEQMPPIPTAHHIFLESRQSEVTKIHIIFCPPSGARKGISLWTNTSVQSCLYPFFQNQSPTFCSFLKTISTLRSGSTK